MSKSPLKSKPLPNPGESLQNQIIDLIDNEAMMPATIAVMLTVMAGYEWYRFFSDHPPNPILMSLIALFSIFYAIAKFRKTMNKVEKLKQGRDGEKAVGQYLERLREQGARILHDFKGEDFNIDHIVIHSSGVYAIETKTYSKPDKGEATIIFNGESVSLLGNLNDIKPVNQAIANAKWIQEQITESTGKKLKVRAVVLFPGWFIQPTAEARHSDVWVLNPKALPAFIQNSNRSLKDSDVKMIDLHLSRLMRAI